MKKILLTAALVMVATSAFAVSNIAATKHNLASGGGQSVVGTNDQLCKYCHTPHNAIAAVPLWNRTNASGIATKYVSGSMYASSAVPAGTSLMCLSCHDSSPTAQAQDTTIGITGSLTVTKQINDATNGMADDHPVSINYEAAKIVDGGLKTVTAATPLFSGKVECGSCHAVHDNSFAPFLRMDNAGSNLCLACHAK